MAAVFANNIYNWTPHVPTRLYYSPGDEAVPAANSLTAYAIGNVAVPTHANCGAPYLNDVFTYFAGMAQNL